MSNSACDTPPDAEIIFVSVSIVILVPAVNSSCFVSNYDCDTPPVAEIVFVVILIVVVSVVVTIVILSPAVNISCFQLISDLVKPLPLALSTKVCIVDPPTVKSPHVI